MAQSVDVEPAAGPSASNGHAPSNGHSNGEGSSGGEGRERSGAMEYDGEDGFKPLWPGSDVDRREFVRLTLQALKEIGYTDAADALRAESGFVLEAPTVTDFRTGVLTGQWDAVDRLLDELPQDAITDLTTVRFAILQQKFLEALEAKNTKRALSILRNELAPLQHDSNRLHLLSSWIMCNSPEDLRTRAGWDGVAGQSRDLLLVDLQKYISPSVLIPQRRLAILLEQAKAYQRLHCVYHAADTPISLLADCSCDPDLFPTVTTNILTGHTNEVWRAEFSHNGKWLATAGADMRVIIWDVDDNFSVAQIFEEHEEKIGSLAWSPDDSVLLTSAEQIIKIWNTETGVCINTVAASHIYPVGALAWFPDGKSFVSGGMDSLVCCWDLAGHLTHLTAHQPCRSRVIDLAITPDGKKMVIVGRRDLPYISASQAGSTPGSRSETPAPTPPIIAQCEKRITVIDLATKKVEYEITQPAELTSVKVTKDSRFAIISQMSNEILFLDLRDGTVVRRFEGHRHTQYVLGSCFGGVLQNYVLSGSEDGKVYLWHRDTGQLLHALAGHGGGSVNAVSWNSAHPGMFASVSDDRTVRIWGFPPTLEDKREGKRAVR